MAGCCRSEDCQGGTKGMSGKRVWVVGTDIGGTFTDVIGVNLETGEQRIGKVPSTPPTFFDGVINGLARAGIRGEETLSFRHGATVSTNAILERKGVKTALITTEGFRDVLGGGRAERISAFELDWDPPELIVPRRNVLVVRERVSPYGEIVTPLAEEDVQRAARMIKKRSIESVAVVYMDSFMNPVHELRTRESCVRSCPISTSRYRTKCCRRCSNSSAPARRCSMPMCRRSSRIT